jgi:hypothetical protein
LLQDNKIIATKNKNKPNPWYIIFIEKKNQKKLIFLFKKYNYILDMKILNLLTLGLAFLGMTFVNAQFPPPPPQPSSNSLVAQISGPTNFTTSVNTQIVLDASLSVDMASSTGKPSHYRWISQQMPNLANFDTPIINFTVPDPALIGIDLTVCNNIGNCSAVLPIRIRVTNQTIISSNGTFVPPNGTFVPPNGTFVPPNGTFVPPNGTFTEPNGTFVPPNGTFVPPNGTFTEPNGTFVPPNGTFTEPNGTFVPPNGTFVPPNGTFVPPNGTFVPPNGTFVPPNGTFVPPNGTFVHPNGTFVPPNGTFVPPNGTFVPPNGTFVPPNGTFVPPFEPPKKISLIALVSSSFLTVTAGLPLTLDGSMSVDFESSTGKPEFYRWICVEKCYESLINSLHNRPILRINTSSYVDITEITTIYIGFMVCNRKQNCSEAIGIQIILTPMPKDIPTDMLFSTSIVQTYPRTKLMGEIPVNSNFEARVMVSPENRYNTEWFINGRNAPLSWNPNRYTLQIPANILESNKTYKISVNVSNRYYTQSSDFELSILPLPQITGEINVSTTTIIPFVTPVTLSFTQLDGNYLYIWGIINNGVPQPLCSPQTNSILNNVILSSNNPTIPGRVKIYISILDGNTNLPLTRIIKDIPIAAFNNNLETQASSVLNETMNIVNNGDISDSSKKLSEVSTLLDYIPDKQKVRDLLLRTMSQMGDIVNNDPSKLKNSDMPYLVVSLNKVVSSGLNVSDNATNIIDMSKKTLKPLLNVLLSRQQETSLLQNDIVLTNEVVQEITKESFKSVDSLMNLNVKHDDIKELHSIVDDTIRAGVASGDKIEFNGERYQVVGSTSPFNLTSYVNATGLMNLFNNNDQAFVRVMNTSINPYNTSGIIISFVVSRIDNGSEISVNNLSTPIKIDFGTNTNKTCAFWNGTAWDSTGLTTKINNNRIICETPHLTDFSLVQSTSNTNGGSTETRTDTSENNNDNMIIIIGIIIGIVAFAAIITVVVIKKRKKSTILPMSNSNPVLIYK